MKNIVVTMALLVLCSAILLFQMDANMTERESYRVKYTADRMAGAATLFTDPYWYGRGRIVFEDSEGLGAALEIFRDNLGYGGSFFPVRNTFFTEAARVSLCFFDDSLNARRYVNGALASEFSFSYGEDAGVYDAAFAGDGFIIEKPCVLCVIDAGRPALRASLLSGSVKIVKKSIYEYK